MDPRNPAPHVVRFGVFELDTQSGELHRHGLRIRLPDQSFQILRLLLSRPAQVVTREELRQALWTSETFVDFDVGLNSAVRKLREALDDSPENARFIETLPRRGYRFIAPVSPRVDQARESQTATETATPSRRGMRAGWIAGGLLLAAAIVAFGVVYARGGIVRQRARTAAAPIRSLVVLPFENQSGDAAQEYFAEAVTDALTTHLAQVEGLDVISRTSARQYKRPNKRLPAIGSELNVDAVLEGAVARSGERVRVSAQLIHAATDRHVWAQNYDGELSHILTLQHRIASDVAAATGHKPAASATSRRARQTVHPEAHDAYLKGVKTLGSRRYEDFRTAVAYFEEAVARQPDFAEAHAALAQAQVQFLHAGPLSPRQTMPKAEAAARKALELDETLAIAHRALGMVLTFFHWKWDEGEKEFQLARELSGGSDEASAAANLSLIRNGRFAEALAEAERARARDPRSFGAQVNVASAYRAAGQHDRAIAELRRAVEMNREPSRAHFQLGVTYVAMGHIDDAIREFEAALGTPRERNAKVEAYLGYGYAVRGRAPEARRILHALESLRREQYVSSFGMALIQDALGERARALAAFERAYEDRAVEFAQMSEYPAFKTIAPEPRFQALMRLVGLPRHTSKSGPATASLQVTEDQSQAPF
jgi:TolB-like protein/DNA-binding winged helix-turn-helix (wHTH) protein/Flp pilus assembly protein TadD